MKKCPKCGLSFSNGSFCVICGVQLEEVEIKKPSEKERKHCKYCGYPLDVGKHCTYCGALIEGEDPSLERQPITKEDNPTYNPFMDQMVKMPLRELIKEKGKDDR